MSVKKSLILMEGDRYSFAELNINVKLTPVMEEVLWTLQVLFILLFTSSFINIVKFLCRFLNRSPKAIGSTLQSLADLGLIDYYRSGRSRVVKLHFEHPFLASSLFRFFGFNTWLLDQKSAISEGDHHLFGFLPSEKNVQKFFAFLQLKEQQLDAKIADYQEWIDWVLKVEYTVTTAKDVLVEDSEETAEHPIHLFAEEIVSRIKQAEVPQVNHLDIIKLTNVILSVFADYREEPPWIDEAYLRQQAFLKGDEQLEGLYENR